MSQVLHSLKLLIYLGASVFGGYTLITLIPPDPKEIKKKLPEAQAGYSKQTEERTKLMLDILKQAASKNDSE
ncbi:uncharacterized protein LOC143222758 isoform X2 [Tachypleus tridentatus]|uniref:uncharacterized protein LOC143222758 isoform X2 n=1 Tax=Tachypleus tridentatus TaxID=6853 RepID=UPI003FCF3471